MKTLSLLWILVLSPLSAFAASGHSHHLGIFAGGTLVSSSVHPTLGVDYSYLFSPQLGITALADWSYASPAPNPWVLAVGPRVMPCADLGLRFLVAPGVELAGGHSSFIVRAGTGYEFHVNNLSFGPSAAVDLFGPHTAWVFGAEFGIGF